MKYKDIKIIGVQDLNLDLFEGQYPVKQGVSYNSYLITDSDIAIVDTVDERKTEDWLYNLDNALEGKTPKYIIVHHVEPDHSGSIKALLKKYPDITLVGNSKTLAMLKQFYAIDFKDTKLVNSGDELSLGSYTLKFVFAPMVHWPEVMVSYIKELKVLFSADAFGTFGFDLDNWEEEASRYYFGIVGKYGLQANKLVQIARSLDIDAILPLHGPILSSNINYYLDLYDKWSKYEATKKGVAIFVSSVYGNTMKAAVKLDEELKALNVPSEVIDINKYDLSYSVSKAFLYEKAVFASITYNGDMFPRMKDLLNRLNERQYQNRIVGFMENGSWGIVSGKQMRASLEGLKNITMLEETVSIKSSMNDDNLSQIKSLALKLRG